MTLLDRSRFATAPRIAVATTAVRNQSQKFDPHSGEGARLTGGRFNPANSFATLYLCETHACAVAELTRQGLRHVVGIEGLLLRVLYRYALDLARVVDLTDDAVREHVGISRADLVGDDWSLCQDIGTEAHAHGDQAIRTFSATGVDTVLAAFPELLGNGLVQVEELERWDVADNL